ncbi:MAG TPA: DNA polymerase III subunit beta [Candidatus Hydrogenedens sp.]|nr:DNA polymerase III subunit beta [Candidatus Hydrogenedens sp.]
MKISVKQEKLSEALSKVRNAVPAKSSLPILSSVLLTAEEGILKLVSTDLRMTIEQELEECEIMEEGKITIRAHLFSNLLSNLTKGDVVIKSIGENQVMVKSGSTEVKYITMPPEEFPPVMLIEDTEPLIMSESLLLDMFKKVVFAVCREDVKYTLTGVLFELNEGKLTVVATDGKRLSLRREVENVPKKKSVRITIPERTVRELMTQMNGLGDVEIFAGESRASFQFDKTKLVTSLIEGTFPNYEVVIPKEYSKHVIIDTESWKAVLRRAQAMKSMSLKLLIKKGQIDVDVQNPEVGEFRDIVEVDYDGEEVKIGFNIEYLADVAENITTDKLVMSVKDGSNPCIIKPKTQEEERDERYLNVIMPIRL